MNHTHSQRHKALLATSLVSMVLGSIHAFSVFLTPLETRFGATRESISLVYSFSLVFLTATVLFGPAIYARVRPAVIYLCVAVLGASGAALASFANGLEMVWLGYSCLFGIANGLGYGFGLQFAARAYPVRAGFAMAVVTAAYALGAVLAPYGFDIALAQGGFAQAMFGLSVIVLIVGGVAAWIVAHSGIDYADAKRSQSPSKLPRGRIGVLWIAYGSGVAAGLMAIGHASGIAAVAGIEGWVAVAAIAGCNLVGSLFSGWLSDKVSHRKILTALPLLGGVALAALTVLPMQAIILLGVIGFAYGGTIASYPAAIALRFPGEDGPRVYGRVFTAWGVAGLAAPWFAGCMYDWGGSYSVALWAAAALCVISAVTARVAIRGEP